MRKKHGDTGSGEEPPMMGTQHVVWKAPPAPPQGTVGMMGREDLGTTTT